MVDVKDTAPCAYCGLPTFQRADKHKGTEPEKLYCCLGCRIAAGLMQSDEPSDSSRSALTRLALAIFFTMNVMVFTMVLWTWDVHTVENETRIQAFHEVLRYACFFFSCPVIILLGIPLVESTWDAFKRQIFTTDVLLLVGVVAAFVYSVVSLLLDFPHIYFEVACMILIAVTLGKWLEATAKLKATNALRSLRQLLPSTVRRVNEDKESDVALEEVQRDDRLRILAGERIPVDGILESETCTIDDQVITGESIPKSKEAGAVLHGGSLNLSGEIILRATSTATDGAIARLASAVESATRLSCRAIRLADRLAAWFAPLILVVCVFAFTRYLQDGFQTALMTSLSVVLIACPCALGIATPLALWVAINTGARNGVLFRNGDAVMNLAKIRSIGFDKTGTITSGDLRVSSRIYDSSDDRDLVDQIATRLAAASNHVLSAAIVNSIDLTESGKTNDLEITQLAEHPGKGVTATINGSSFGYAPQNAMLGSSRFATELGFEMSTEMRNAVAARPDLSLVCVAFAGRVTGVFLTVEELRPEAMDVTQKLKAQNLHLSILTGDQQRRADALAESIGVETTGELLPEDKSNCLRDLPQPVAMVGDGVNDSLALAVADVGIALDCGADISRDAADICLMGNSIANLPWAIDLARAARGTIRRNLAWAVGYNAIGIGFAATGNLNPILAAIAMVASSFFVLVNSLRLQTFETTASHHRETSTGHNEVNGKTKQSIHPTDSPQLQAVPQ